MVYQNIAIYNANTALMNKWLFTCSVDSETQKMLYLHHWPTERKFNQLWLDLR